MIGGFVEIDLARDIALAAALLVVLLLLYRRLRSAGRFRRASRPATPGTTGARSQVAAIPVRPAARGALEVLVISTRGSGRWTVPKGWPMPGRSDAEAAAQEAYEEAGVRGTILSEPIGTFEYAKRRSDSQTLRVTVYRLDVEQNVRRWRERGQRKQRWLTTAAAADCVAWTGLAEIIRSLETNPRA
jgi:8-oxo-dGTP pyrophosphatase MutT (NUDIX family)